MQKCSVLYVDNMHSKGMSNASLPLCEASAVHYRCLAKSKQTGCFLSAWKWGRHLEDERRRQTEREREEEAGSRGKVRRRREEEALDGLTNRATWEGRAPCWISPLRCSNGFGHNETITLTKDPQLQRGKAIMLKGQGQSVRFLQLTLRSANNVTIVAFLILLLLLFFFFFE